MMMQTLHQEQRLLQIMTQAHKIEIANLISVPDEVMQAVVGAISYNPDSIEAILQSRKQIPKGQDYPNASSKVQSIYASLTSAKDQAEEERKCFGKIISPDLSILKDHFKPYDSVFTPDATYIGREGNKPSIVYSDHLRGAMGLSMIQVDPIQFPETSKLISHLKKFDEWKRGKLRDSYVYLGDAQREYFEKFDPGRLQMFVQKDLGERLAIDDSTVSRILENRFVEIRNVNDAQKVMRSKDLFITRYDLQRYAVAPLINAIFEEEFSRGKAFSDYDIAGRVKGIARRTLTKYRTESNIPNTSERNNQYASGVILIPYKLISYH